MAVFLKRRIKSNMVNIREKNDSDNSWITNLLVNNWGGESIITKRKVYFVQELKGFIAENDHQSIGLCLYNIANNECEISFLEAFQQYKGIGTALINKIFEIGIKEHLKRIWLITTNDNIDALRFYQKRNFILKDIYRNEIAETRKIKPNIPQKGYYNIPIRDEIELEYIIIS
jgi:ribosomal protein S18 acetylase RimI-like enzyme